MTALLLQAAVLVALAAPAALAAALLVGLVWPRPPQEVLVARLTSAALATSVLSLLVAFALWALRGAEPLTWTARRWFSTGAGAFRFDLWVDGRSIVMALLAAVVCGTVGAFSYRYLHREPGFHRYFVLFATFTLGILLVCLAGSVEVLFAGWELLGLSSALLVAFFHERPRPVHNALRVFAVYRVSDAAMLVAAVAIHHATGSGSLGALFLGQDIGLTTGEATFVGLFLLLAVMGKSALVPFVGWLPRAMEGPTPSSAVYYGALSVHAGVWLLWRCGPLLEQAPVVRAAALVVGVATAVVATIVARVQTDVKSALSFATLTQVGLIVVEIALGLYTLAFVHLVGNAALRLVQFLTAPNALADLRGLEHVPVRERASPRWHALAMDRDLFDALLDRWIVGPVWAMAQALGRLDRFLAGEREQA